MSILKYIFLFILHELFDKSGMICRMLCILLQNQQEKIWH